MILAAAQRGALTERVSEERLVGMLSQISEREATAAPRITIQRRRHALDSDSD
jgi:DNA-binding TFAR19-related protein (PDSD5 family)